ncbi:aminotransferase class V-fold PLP-dependent enzyme [Ruthenibacterium sp. CLA-JM-H11]|uniref:Aminotransferase class V-fold PLP-dependent enzyme n=1 Tax=Ruthenibacterium intestinale TaxID=3133163 RepID=A0ABV1GB35_9FIRM
MDETLFMALQRYGREDAIPMHMPGHKRNEALAPYLKALGAGLDITEIDGFDDLHGAEGILRRGMERAAQLWGAKRSFYLVNGSTCGILAAIHAVLGQGGSAIVARNCHKSVYHGLELCGITPHFLLPPVESRFGICASIAPAEVERALQTHPDVRLVIVTSPTYEGVVSDIRAIADVAHRHHAVLLVDEAHGAHLGMGNFPAGAVACGADVVIQSAHKTLPSLTQTALLHLQGELVDPERVAHSLEIFETSSPSYLLMASLDSCVALLLEQGQHLLQEWNASLQAFGQEVRSLQHLRILGYTAAPDSSVYALDPSKIVISTAGTSVTGPELMGSLRKEANIELEMAASDYVIAMTGMGDTADTFHALARALCKADRMIQTSPSAAVRPALQLPRRLCSAQEAVFGAREKCPLDKAAGRVSAGYVWAYPPGIPLLVPGEEIDAALLSVFKGLQESGVSLRGLSGGLWVRKA